MSEPTAVDIVLIEDNPEDAELTLRALRRANLVNPVRVLEDGAAALDFLLGRGTDPNGPGTPRPRLVLLDLKLPKLTGIEVLRKLRAEERTRTLPVVVLTSSAEDSDIRECYSLGVNSYIVKPVDFEKFAATVSEVGCYWLLLNSPPP
jgi:two-component system response regulator